MKHFTLSALLLLLISLSASAQTTLQLPKFKDVVGTQLVNTNGQWVRVDPAQPNNIDLVETRIFKMPKKGDGVLAVEFKLVGGDGGTAWYKNLVDNRFANGGRGGDIYFSINMTGQGNFGTSTFYDRPFMVTFGKKGESVTLDKGYYVAAGGGGSTGMSWIVGQDFTKWFGKRTAPQLAESYGTMIAAAGGGSGGYASVYRSTHGASAWYWGSKGDKYEDNYNVWKAWTIARNDEFVISYVAGGSAIRNDMWDLNPNYCCSEVLKRRYTSGLTHNVSQATVSNGVLTSLTYGQEGGKPFIGQASEDGTVGGMGATFHMTGVDRTFYRMGGRGGSGLSGGGAGVSTIWHDWGFSSVDEAKIPTSGAGGTGSSGDQSFPRSNYLAGEPGYNMYSYILKDYGVIEHNSTNSPQSGYFMYRTIADSIPPQIRMTAMTVNLGNGMNTPLIYTAYSPTVSFQQAIQPYLMKDNGIWDNDGISSVTASEPEFQCFMAGQTIPVQVTVTDGAGNSTNGTIMVTVVDPFVPVPSKEESTDFFDPEQKIRIDVSNGPVTLTAANFPTPFDGCKSPQTVTIHFPPTTFTCADAGSRDVSYYYTDIDGHDSYSYTKTFKVLYNYLDKVYVDPTATGTGNGSSWQNAFTNLQDALSYGCSGNSEGRTVYVAQGTYYPDRRQGVSSLDRNASFILRENDKIYGGFPNGGDVFANRNPEAYPTVLSGEIRTVDREDNSYHVVTIAGNNTVLEGFTIRDGYANTDSTGGGGLMLEQAFDSTASSAYYSTIRNCKFINNYGDNGGAVYTDHQNYNSSNYLYVQNCQFEENTAINGGAFYLKNDTEYAPDTHQSIVNCIFQNNMASANGGGLYISPNTDVNIINSTFLDNDAGTSGKAIFNQGTAHLHNSILWGGATGLISNSGTFHADYSDIQGSGGSGAWALTTVSDGGGNIDADPQFNPSSPFVLMPQSPCRNAGNNTYNIEATDAMNNVRISEDVIDMGAVEVNPILYVAWDAAPGGNGTTWATAYNNLSDVIRDVGTGWAQKSIWVKEGTYRPDRVSYNSAATPGNRENTFWLWGYARMYGGFAGNETQLSQRNIGQHPTILSGDIGTSGVQTDNAYHVITAMGGGTRLDGFIIEGGYANGSDNASNGAGYFDYAASPTINNVITNCVFRNNTASGNGGAVYSYVNNTTHGTIDFDQCLFYNNTAGRGAAAYVYVNYPRGAYADLSFYNITAVNNTSLTSGAGAFEGFGTAGYPARVHFYNSLLVENTPQNYNDVSNPGQITLTGTYTAASGSGIFADLTNFSGADGKIMTADDGLRLHINSPAINYGDTTYIYNRSGKDIAGNRRVEQTIVDAGAYETYSCMGLTALYVDAGAISNQGDGSSWQRAFRTLREAVNMANVCENVDSILIAKGTYYPADADAIVSRDISFEIWKPIKILGGYPTGGGVRHGIRI